MTMPERIRRSRRIGRGAWLLFALFSLRAVVPIGYMPAPIGEGGPFVLCHGASAETIALLQAHDAMHGAAAGIQDDVPGLHGGDSSHDRLLDYPATLHEESWEQCPLGIGSADAAIAFAEALQSVEPAQPESLSSEATLPILSALVRFRARAPPV